MKNIVTCLLTTQQNSSSDSPLANFCRELPFTLDLKTCSSQSDLQEYIADKLVNYGGIRRHITIASELTSNFRKLESTNWEVFDTVILNLNRRISDPSHLIPLEREQADYINFDLKGFGHKQSRNLLQMLGLSIYEIPIDSRIIYWLENFGFPLKISQSALQDKNYYNFIADAIQNLCEQSKVYPCMLDAAIFENADKGKWTLENNIY